VSPEPSYRCPWCLRDTYNPNDIEHKFCPCCGDDELSRRDCEHRTKQTLSELFQAGVRLVRRDPWADGNYLELVAVGGFFAPLGRLHSPLEWNGTPADLRMADQQIPLWLTPKGGWEAYTGPTVDERRMTIDTDAQGRRWLVKPPVREEPPI
jgi:hypothetical protein